MGFRGWALIGYILLPVLDKGLSRGSRPEERKNLVAEAVELLDTGR